MARETEVVHRMRCLRHGLKILGSEIALREFSENTICEVEEACDYAIEIFLENKESFKSSSDIFIRSRAERVNDAATRDNLLDRISLDGIDVGMCASTRDTLYSLVWIALIFITRSRYDVEKAAEDAKVICAQCGAKYKAVGEIYDTRTYTPTCTCQERNVLIID